MRPILYLIMVMTAVLILNLQSRQNEPAPVKATEVQTPTIEETVEITAMRFHAGQLYTGDHGGRIRVLSMPEGHSVADWYGHPTAVRQILFADDKLVTIGRNGSVATWQKNNELQKRRRLVGHHLNDAVSLGDGGFIVAGDRGVVARIGFGPRWRVNGIHGRAAFGLALSPDREQLVSVGADGMARIWSVADGTIEHEWKAHDGWVSSVTWHKTGIWTAGTDGYIVHWAPTTRRVLKRQKTAHREVTRLLMSDEYIVTTGSDFKVAIYSQKDVAEPQLIDLVDRPFVSLSLNGKDLWVGHKGGGISTWDVTNGRESATFPTKF